MDVTKENPASGATASGATAVGATAVSATAAPAPPAAPPAGPTSTAAAQYPPAAPYPAAPGAYRPPVMASDAQVTWSTLAHLSWIVGSVLGGLTFLGPVVAWLALKDRGPFVRHHAGEALNAHLSYLSYTFVLGAATTLFAVVTFGIGAGALLAPVAVAVVGIVFSIVAAVSASRGTWYRYPLVIRFVS